MHEDILLVIGFGDKSEALGGVEPFYCSLSSGGSSEAAGESQASSGNGDTRSEDAKGEHLTKDTMPAIVFWKATFNVIRYWE